MPSIQASPYTLITSHCIEGILLGMNCILYTFCLYTLWGQKSISCRLLLLVNTVQFLLCVTQTTLHTVFGFVLFTVLVGDIQPYLRVYVLGSAVIFVINFVLAGLSSIWRLYVLYDSEIGVCIPAIIFWIAQVCVSGIAIRVRAATPLTLTSPSLVITLLWVLITTLYLSVAVPICFRLCIAQKRTHAVLSASPHKSIAVVLVECGALITACSLGMTVLYVCNHAYSFASLGVATEVAIASQLLVTARHGMSRSHNLTSTVLGIDVRRGGSTRRSTSVVEGKHGLDS